MDFYLDCEFLEGSQKKLFGKTKPTIDLISIGLVSEDNREYYAISKDFNLKEAWNRYDLKPDIDNGGMKKIYWIRENVLKPIFEQLLNPIMDPRDNSLRKYNYKNFRTLINKYGKTDSQIAKEVNNFVFPDYRDIKINKAPNEVSIRLMENENWVERDYLEPKFYTYYGAYDWVVFCWLFGKMLDLPKGFPMFSFDLKQILDEKQEIRYKLKKVIDETKTLSKHEESSLVNPLKIKDHPDYPKQSNEHNALSDARWNFEFHKFIKKF